MNSTGDVFAPFSQMKPHLCFPTKSAVRVSLFPATLVDGAPAQCSVLLMGNFASIESFHCFQPSEKLTHKNVIIYKRIRFIKIQIIDDNVVFVLLDFCHTG